MTDPNGAAIYGAPWIPSMYPLYVSSHIPAPWIRHGVWSIGFIHHGKNWKIHARITMSAAYDLGGFGIMCSDENKAALWNHRTLESSGGGLWVYGELNQNRGNLQVPKNRWRMDVYSPSHMVTMAFDTDPHFTKAAIPRCRQKTGLHFTYPLAI